MTTTKNEIEDLKALTWEEASEIQEGKCEHFTVGPLVTHSNGCLWNIQETEGDKKKKTVDLGEWFARGKNVWDNTDRSAGKYDIMMQPVDGNYNVLKAMESMAKGELKQRLVCDTDTISAEEVEAIKEVLESESSKIQPHVDGYKKGVKFRINLSASGTSAFCTEVKYPDPEDAGHFKLCKSQKGKERRVPDVDRGSSIVYKFRLKKVTLGNISEHGLSFEIAELIDYGEADANLQPYTAPIDMQAALQQDWSLDPQIQTFKTGQGKYLTFQKRMPEILLANRDAIGNLTPVTIKSIKQKNDENGNPKDKGTMYVECIAGSDMLGFVEAMTEKVRDAVDATLKSADAKKALKKLKKNEDLEKKTKWITPLLPVQTEAEIVAAGGKAEWCTDNRTMKVQINLPGNQQASKFYKVLAGLPSGEEWSSYLLNHGPEVLKASGIIKEVNWDEVGRKANAFLHIGASKIDAVQDGKMTCFNVNSSCVFLTDMGNCGTDNEHQMQLDGKNVSVTAANEEEDEEDFIKARNLKRGIEDANADPSDTKRPKEDNDSNASGGTEIMPEEDEEMGTQQIAEDE